MPAFRTAYDHRLRNHVCDEGNPQLALKLGVPRSTVASWLRRGPRDVVSAEIFSADLRQLQARFLKLQARAEMLLEISRLLFFLVGLLGARLDSDRLHQGTSKQRVLDAIARATKVIPLVVALRVLGLSPSRYYSWKSLPKDCLDDRSSCPRISPTQLTPSEVRTMHQMTTDPGLRHIPVTGLALLAQRLKKAFASPATWSKLIRERGWRRPRTRLHPKKPIEGVRATQPNKYWHIDVTVIRLLDGSRVYLHAIIDNFSRKILSWSVSTKLEIANTILVLNNAATHLPPFADLSDKPTLVADSGVENVNGEVDKFLGATGLQRVLAQVEVTFSNSMIEAWWRSLKHNWLFLNQLDSLAAVERLVAFYVQQHNSVMPHPAFNGQTPDEMYLQNGAHVPDDLAAARKDARQARIAANRALSCDACRSAAGPLPSANSDMLHLPPDRS